MIIDVKKAVKIASDAIKDLYSDKIQTDLEEVEISDDEKYWLITLGFDTPKDKTVMLSRLIEKNTKSKKRCIRKYKIFKIDSDNGKVLSMKIRRV